MQHTKEFEPALLGIDLARARADAAISVSSRDRRKAELAIWEVFPLKAEAIIAEAEAEAYAATANTGQYAANSRGANCQATDRNRIIAEYLRSYLLRVAA